MDIVFEGFVISEAHDAHTFVLDLLSKMCPLSGEKDVHAVFSDEFMTHSILDSIDMIDTHIFYEHYHLKFKLEKALLMKGKVLQPFINLMFKESDEKKYEMLYMSK